MQRHPDRAGDGEIHAHPDSTYVIFGMAVVVQATSKPPVMAAATLKLLLLNEHDDRLAVRVRPFLDMNPPARVQPARLGPRFLPLL